MKTILLILFFIPFVPCAQPTPGGIGTNLSFWIKADAGVYSDAGVTAAIDGNTIQQWNDFSGTSKNASQSTAGIRPVYLSNATDHLNYNPLLRFDGTKAMNAATVITGGNSPYDAYTVSTTADNHNGQIQLIFSQGNSGTSFRNLQLGYNYFSANVRKIHHNWNSSGYQTANNVADVNKANLIEYAFNQPTNERHILKSGIDAVSPLNANTLNLSGNVGIGYERVNNANFHIGDIAEIVVYNAYNTTTERQKIQSYLAVKYGVTLSNSGGGTNGDYISGGGTLLWDASVNSGYHNNVIGIGRDDASALLQKQSHQADDSTRIYVSSLASDNVSNGGSFGSDEQFVMMANDNQLLRHSYTNTEFPTGLGIYSRLDREWKITNTAFTGTFSMDIKPNTSPITASDLRVLIDDDGDFTNATLYNPSISYSSGVITISGLSNSLIPANSTKYLTVVSMNSTTPLPVELINFTAKPVNNKYVQLDWQTASEINSESFAIERSVDGIQWQQVTVISAAGNSSTTLSYSYQDHNPMNEVSYYRIRQTDNDGKYTISPVRNVTIEFTSVHNLHIYPNPAHSKVIIDGEGDVTDGINLFDAIGRDVSSLVKINMINNNRLEIDLAILPPGVYIVRANNAVGKIWKR